MKTYSEREGNRRENHLLKDRIACGALSVLLMLAVLLLFTAALNSYAPGSLQTTIYPDSPRYDSVPIAFTISFDPQRVKRVTNDAHRLILPVRYAAVPCEASSGLTETFAPYPITLPLLVASPKSLHQSCLLVDIPPPSL